MVYKPRILADVLNLLTNQWYKLSENTTVTLADAVDMVCDLELEAEVGE